MKQWHRLMQMDGRRHSKVKWIHSENKNVYQLEHTLTQHQYQLVHITHSHNHTGN